MIAGATRGAGGGALAAHLANAEHNEEVRPGESRGLTATDIRSQIDELTRLGSHARTSQPIYHVHIDPPEGWGKEARDRYKELLLKEFGLEGRPYASVIHEKNGRTHEHLAILRVDASGKAIRLDNDFQRREKISRIVEHEFGMPFTKGAHNRAVIHALRAERPEIAQAMEAASLHEGTRPRARVTPQERMQEERTQVSKAEVAKLTATAWTGSDNGQAFAHALREQGLALAQGDKVPVVVDQSGNTHSLARMLAMAARSNGEPAPKSADIQARLQGVELPSLDDARSQVAPVQPVEVAPTPIPEPPQPGGGEHVRLEVVPSSQETASITAISTDGNAPTHAHAHAHAGGTPKPSSGGGAGGGASSPSHDAPQAPLPSLDVGEGPGEPPRPGAHPDEIARFAAKLQAYQERKERAWQAWLKAWESQAKSKRNPKISGGGGDNGIDEKALRERASEIIRSIKDATERSIALRAFYSAFEKFTADESGGPRLAGDGEGPSPQNGRDARGGDPGIVHLGRDGSAQGIGRAERDGSVAPGHGSDAKGDGGVEDAERRNPLSLAAENLAHRRLASLCDGSGIRAAIAALNPPPDPLAGLDGRARRERANELRAELWERYSADHQAMKSQGRDTWRAAMAMEKIRSSPLAESLRQGWKHLSPSEREQGWQAIRKAKETLVQRLKAEAEEHPARSFKRWLTFVAQTDPKAAAVLAEMRAADERKAKIQASLAEGRERLEALRRTAPTGERDEDVAARDVKERMKTEHASREANALKARQEAAEAASRVKWWHFGKNHPVRVAARQAEQNADAVEHTAMIRAPSQSDFREAMETARSRARSNLRAFQAWEQSPKGMECKALERSLDGIQRAVESKDPRMTRLLSESFDEALKEQRMRELREQKQREAEQRKAMKSDRGQVVQFPAAGPRMR